jgi:ribonuclease E
LGFLILLVFALIGLGAVVWLLKTDSSPKHKPEPPEIVVNKNIKDPFRSDQPEDGQEEKGLPKKEKKKIDLKESIAGFTAKFKDVKMPPPVAKILDPLLKKFSKTPSEPEQEWRDPYKDLEELKQKIRISDEPAEKPPFAEEQAAESFGTASLRTAPLDEQPDPAASLSKDEVKDIEKEIELTSELNELKEKYERLDKLFQEKSQEAASAKESLEHEVRNRKEFNKVKDLLEHELKETKDKVRNIQVKLNSNTAENDSYKKRINQLEEKVTSLEKTIQEKDKEIDELSKDLQSKAAQAEKQTIKQAEEVPAPAAAGPESVPPEAPVTEVKAEAQAAEERPAEEVPAPVAAGPESVPPEAPVTEVKAEAQAAEERPAEEVPAPAAAEPESVPPEAPVTEVKAEAQAAEERPAEEVPAPAAAEPEAVPPETISEAGTEVKFPESETVYTIPKDEEYPRFELKPADEAVSDSSPSSGDITGGSVSEDSNVYDLGANINDLKLRMANPIDEEPDQKDTEDKDNQSEQPESFLSLRPDPLDNGEDENKEKPAG